MGTKQLQTKIQIDAYLKGTEQFWFRLEKNCCLECCGFDALVLSVSHILWSSETLNTKMLVNKLENLLLVLEDTSFETVQSREILCYSTNKTKFIEVFRKIQHIFLSVY